MLAGEGPRRLGRRGRLAVAALALIVVVAVAWAGIQAVTAPRVEAAATRVLGPIGAPATVTARDGGASALIGGRILWTFGDTLSTAKGVDGSSGRSNTAALADPAKPLVVSEPLDTKGVPGALLPFEAEEQAANAAGGPRIALWPTSVVATGAGGGLVFYLKLRVRGPLTYDYVGIGVARIAAGSTVARREAGLLFQGADPLLGYAFVDGDNIVAYGAPIGSGDYRVGRAPLAAATDRAAWRFWTGSQWGTDPAAAAGVLSGIPGAVSVAFNPFLGRYLAVHSEALSGRAVLRTADRPEGPWSRTAVAFEGAPAPSGSFDYAAIQHPELSSNGGRTIAITYYHPLGAFRGELLLVEADLK